MRRRKIVNKDFTKDNLPSNRKELFFDIVKNHYGTLTMIGFILLAFALPYIAVLIVSDYASYDLYNALNNGDISKEQYQAMFNSTSLLLSLIQCASLLIFSIGASGVSKIFKRLLFLEPVFFKEDFKMGVKDSFKTMLVVYLILGLFLVLTKLMGFVNANAFVKALPMGVIIVFIFPIFMMLNIHTTIYKTKIFTRIRLCTMIHVKTFLIHMPACLIVLVFYGLIYIPSMVWKYVAILGCIILLLPMALLLYYDICFYIFDKNINIITYPEIYRKGLMGKPKDKKTRKS